MKLTNLYKYKNSSEFQHESDHSPLKSDTRQDYSRYHYCIFLQVFIAPVDITLYRILGGRFVYGVESLLLVVKCTFSEDNFFKFGSNMRLSTKPKMIEYHFEKVRNYSAVSLSIDFRACAKACML